MHLEWSVLARADRKAIYDYMEADSPHAVIAVDDRIGSRIKDLLQFPEMGRPGRIDGTRELVINSTPYIAAYRISGDTVTILRVLHGTQQWPEEL